MMRGLCLLLPTLECEISRTSHWQSPPPQVPPDTANTATGVPRRPGHGTLPLHSRCTASGPPQYRIQRRLAAIAVLSIHVRDPPDFDACQCIFNSYTGGNRHD